MPEATLVSLLTNGGVPAMFAFLLLYTLYTSNRREERLMAREEKVLAKLDELASTISRISLQLDSLAREIDRMRGDD